MYRNQNLKIERREEVRRRGGTTRVKEERERYEAPRRYTVEGNSNPHYRGFGQIKPTEPLRSRQEDREKKN